jgi:NitT/TauT family transport system permease protein
MEVTVSKRWQHWLMSAAPFGVVVLVWYLLTRSAFIDPVFLPSPGRVFVSFWGLLSREFLLQHLVPSATRVGGAFLLSLAIAFPLGILSGQVPWVARLTEPIFGFTRYLPVAALVPLCILWFGIEDQQKIAVITLGVVFQLVLLFAFDTASVPKELIEGGRTFGLSRFQIVRRIVLPWSLPSMWDDMRISAGWAWSYLVLAELVAGSRGVGYFVIQSQRYLETDRVFAGILFIGILGVITDLFFRFTASRLFRWT